MTEIGLTTGQIVLLVFTTLASSELFLRLPLLSTVGHLQKLTHRIFKTIGSPRISDHWKERVLLIYARQLLSYSLALLILILIALLPLGGSFFLISDSLGGALLLAADALVLTCITVISISYLFLRARFHE